MLVRQVVVTVGIALGISACESAISADFAGWHAAGGARGSTSGAAGMDSDPELTGDAGSGGSSEPGSTEVGGMVGDTSGAAGEGNVGVGGAGDTWPSYTTPLGSLYLADVTGDKLSDLISVAPGCISVLRRTDDEFRAAECWQESLPQTIQFFVRDVSGDGRADLISLGRDRVRVALAQEGKFGAWNEWTVEPFFGVIGTYFGDITGDGRADAVAAQTYGVVALRAEDRSFTDYQTWYDTAAHAHEERLWGYVGGAIADVSGDGRGDIICIDYDAVRVGLADATEARFLPGTEWYRLVLGERETSFVDATGDGKADAIATNYHSILVYPSTGTNFGVAIDSGAECLGGRATLFGNVTDDGAADAVAVGWDAVYVCPAREGKYMKPVKWFTGLVP